MMRILKSFKDFMIKSNDVVRGNFIAVGSMEPAIEMWDLNVLDEVQPSLILGGAIEKKKKKKGKKVEKCVNYKVDSHTGAILSLAWNKSYRNLLASASADKLGKVWVVAISRDGKAPAHFGFKWSVGSVLIATGSEDKMVKLWDLSNNQPSCIASQNRKAGAVFSLSFSEDCPFLLALGGSKGKLEVSIATVLDQPTIKIYDFEISKIYIVTRR
ncbi:uncharacterized WD repeat-containing protein [Tanacetum coccineum]